MKTIEVGDEFIDQDDTTHRVEEIYGMDADDEIVFVRAEDGKDYDLEHDPEYDRWMGEVDEEMPEVFEVDISEDDDLPF